MAKWRVNKIGADTLNTQLNAPATQSGIRVGLGILATIMSYETPRAQFESELIQAAKHARAVAREHRADIIGRAETAAELDRQVTAEDAAIGFISLADTILYDRPRLQQEDGRPELPMLRALVRTLLTETGLKIRLDLSSKQALIEAAAPEIVDAFDEVLPKTQHNKAFAASVRKHETTSTIKHVPGRTGAELTSAVDLFGFKHKNPLRVVQDAIPQLLNGLRKLMPDHRSELADTREWIERVLLQNPQ